MLISRSILFLQVLSSVYNIDLSPHRSKLLSPQDIEGAFMIIPVKRDLGTYIVQNHPNSASKIRYLSKDIPDPWHQPVEVFRVCANNIDGMLNDVIQALLLSKQHK